MLFCTSPSKKPRFACVLDLLSFLCYLELCVQIFRRDLSAPETHESGEFFTRVGPDGVATLPRAREEMLVRSVALGAKGVGTPMGLFVLLKILNILKF